MKTTVTKPSADGETAIRLEAQQTGSPRTPTCGRGAHLAADVQALVSDQCPRCSGTGPQCLVDLLYQEAFPSTETH
jgi:hypothetical protein